MITIVASPSSLEKRNGRNVFLENAVTSKRNNENTDSSSNQYQSCSKTV